MRSGDALEPHSNWRPVISTPHPHPPLHRIAIATALTLAVCAVVAARAWGHPDLATLAFMFAACLLGERMSVRLPFGEATFSMASATNFAAALTLPVGPAMLVVAASTLPAERLWRRKSWIRAAFNVAQSTASVGLAAALFGWIGALPARFDGVEMVWLGAISAAIVQHFTNWSAVAMAVATAESSSFREAWRRNFGSAFAWYASVATFCLGGLLVTQYALAGPLGCALALAPLGLAFEGYRRRYENAGATAAEDDTRDQAA